MAAEKVKVMIVDDEKKILSVARKMLAGQNYELVTTGSADEALDMLEGQGPFSVVISDNRMPNMKGTEFFKKMKTLCPETVRILMTAYYDAQLIEDVVNNGEAFRYLKKPLDFKLVLKTIQAGIDRYEKNMKLKSLEGECGKLSNEKAELETVSQELDSKIDNLHKTKKTLLISILVIMVGFGLFEFYKAWRMNQAIRATSQIVNGWELYENGTALDPKTNLIWMTRDFRNIERRQPRGWAEAMDWANKMNKQRYGGFADWRVPTAEEYQSSYDPEGKQEAFDRKKNVPLGIPLALEPGGGYAYWTNEPVGMERARLFFFVGGFSKTESRNYNNATMSVRLVRNG